MNDLTTAFVVSLGLDPSQYNREIKKYRDDRKRLAEEEKKYNDSAQDGQKRQVETMRILRNETAGFLLTLAGASSVGGFFKGMVSWAADTGRLAENLGMATSRVAAWEAAVKRAGGSPENAQNSLRLMSSLYQQNQLGILDPSAQADLMGLGVSKISQNPEENLLAISRAATRMDRQQFIARASRLGLDQGTINVLAEGPEKLRATLGEMEKLNEGAGELAEQSRELEKAWADLSETFSKAAIPSLIVATRELNSFTKAVVALWKALPGTIGDMFTPKNDGTNPGAPALQEGEGWGDWAIRNLKEWFTPHYGPEASNKEQLYSRKGVNSAGRPADAWLGSRARGSRDGTPARNPAGQRAVALDGNNPGGINDGAFARSQPGYVGNNGRYAAFRTMHDGIAAQRALLASYVQRGYDTPLKISRRWAPAGDGNNPDRYARQIAAQMGIGVNDRIGAAQLAAFQHAQAVAENGRYTRALGGRGTMATARTASTSTRSTTQTNTTSVGTIIINTDGKSAEQISRNIRQELAKRGLTTQANTGLQP